MSVSLLYVCVLLFWQKAHADLANSNSQVQAKNFMVCVWILAKGAHGLGQLQVPSPSQKFQGVCLDFS